jgi:hypothetical protein
MKQTINVRFHHDRIPEIIIDDKAQIWRLPFTGRTGRKYQIKLLEEFYERNYIAYRVHGRIYSKNFMMAHWIPKKYTLQTEITDKKTA